MTEGNDDGSNLVSVRAQVMMRDDSTGGWSPMGAGGLSNVSVRKRFLHPALGGKKPDYLIFGRRISDQELIQDEVVLSCSIKKDFQYTKVIPTFHHWTTGDRRFGLTFQTAADARAFDKGVCRAMDDIRTRDGLHNIPAYFNRHIDVDDDDVFMAVNLPVDGSRSSSGSVTTCSSGSRNTPPTPTGDVLHSRHYTYLHQTSMTSPDLTQYLHQTNIGGGGGGQGGSSTPYVSQASHQPLTRISYLQRMKPQLHSDLTNVDKGVQFHKVPTSQHEESSPPKSIGSYEVSHKERRDSIASLKRHQQQMDLMMGGGVGLSPVSPQDIGLSRQISPGLIPRPIKRAQRKPKPSRMSKGIKFQCHHCHENFDPESNPRGSCEYAPDRVTNCIKKVSCIDCAEGMLYHCMADAEGEFPPVCECKSPTGQCGGHVWVGLAFLSLCLPCLWCYLPLRSCHKWGVSCGLCGGRHELSRHS